MISKYHPPFYIKISNSDYHLFDYNFFKYPFFPWSKSIRLTNFNTKLKDYPDYQLKKMSISSNFIFSY